MRKKFIKEEVIEAIRTSNTLNEVLIKLKRNRGGGNYQGLRKRIIDWNIDTSHFLSRSEIISKAVHAHKRSLNEVLTKNSNYTTGNNLKSKLYKAGLKKKECEECGQGEEWRGRKMSLILDHIDGDHFNNEITNLRILCPNCNATTETFCRGKIS